jgi:hypothetical protein
MKPLTLKSPFPDHILRMIDFAERQKLGKHFRTMNEIQTEGERISERKLHVQIRNLLSLKGIVFLEQRMDKRSRGVKGWPDFTASVVIQKPSKVDPTNVMCVPIAIAWEVKLPGKKLSPEQEEISRKMTAFPNGWHYRVIHSVDEALDDLRNFGL